MMMYLQGNLCWESSLYINKVIGWLRVACMEDFSIYALNSCKIILNTISAQFNEDLGPIIIKVVLKLHECSIDGTCT